MALDTVPDILDDIREGKMVILMDDEDDHLTFANVVQDIWNGIEGHLNSPALARSFAAFL